MTKKVLILLLLLNLNSIHSGEKKKTKLYKGAWFEVDYPSDFSKKPSIKSQSVDGYDSCYFISPDKKVKFYIFSPQWSGDATDISLIESKEISIDEKTEKNKSISKRFFTYQAKNKSYSRSYVETIDEASNTKHVFGIEYQDKKSYEKYKSKYIEFKKTLKQFAD